MTPPPYQHEEVRNTMPTETAANGYARGPPAKYPSGVIT